MFDREFELPLAAHSPQNPLSGLRAMGAPTDTRLTAALAAKVQQQYS